MRITTGRLQYFLNDSVGDKSWGELIWEIVEPSKLTRAHTQFGSYSIEVQPDSYRLTFNTGSDVRSCPTKFQAINRVQWEAGDHHRRMLARQQPGTRMKPPKW
jgi:hypothetical protein